MAILTVRHRLDLGPKFVLAPERYDPRRNMLKDVNGSVGSVPLRSIASTVKQTINPAGRSQQGRRFLVFDTADVREGIVMSSKRPVPIDALGSAKRGFQPGDVLISRLRPYLRQVAFVDDGRVDAISGETEMVCSTEFIVLRSENSESIAFLVPFLLSTPVQRVLCASQEGGHHPRFDEETLLDLPIPERLVEIRESSSAEVIRGISLYRESEDTMGKLIATAERTITLKGPISPPEETRSKPCQSR